MWTRIFFGKHSFNTAFGEQKIKRIEFFPVPEFCRCTSHDGFFPWDERYIYLLVYLLSIDPMEVNMPYMDPLGSISPSDFLQDFWRKKCMMSGNISASWEGGDLNFFSWHTEETNAGSTIRTLLHGKINPKWLTGIVPSWCRVSPIF